MRLRRRLWCPHLRSPDDSELRSAHQLCGADATNLCGADATNLRGADATNLRAADANLCGAGATVCAACAGAAGAGAGATTHRANTNRTPGEARAEDGSAGGRQAC